MIKYCVRAICFLICYVPFIAFGMNANFNDGQEIGYIHNGMNLQIDAQLNFSHFMSFTGKAVRVRPIPKGMIEVEGLIEKEAVDSNIVAFIVYGHPTCPPDPRPRGGCGDP